MLRSQPTDQPADLKEFAGNCAEQGRTRVNCATECDPVACARTGIIPPSCRAKGGRLVALEGSDLANLFYCWTGQSGARHVCRVIPIEQEATIADYIDVVAIAVLRTGRPVRDLILEGGLVTAEVLDELLSPVALSGVQGTGPLPPMTPELISQMERVLDEADLRDDS